MAELAAFLGLDKSSVSGLVDRAEARGLVERLRLEEDRRSSRVALTADGQALATSAAAQVHREVADFAAVLTAPEQRRLAALLTRLSVDRP
jgi:DNA-binding MarR family transcriptional regulator